MDAEMAKQFQKMLTKQGFKFKLNTKVVSGRVENDKVYLEVDAAKGGKPETVCSLYTVSYISWMLISSSFPSVVDRTQKISISRPSESKKTIKVVSSSIQNTAHPIPTSDVSAMSRSAPCLPIKPKRKASPQQNTLNLVTAMSTTAPSQASSIHIPKLPG